MVVVMGIIMWILINIWLTIFTFGATVPTFGESLFTSGFFYKLLGVLLWVVTFYSWYALGSNIEIKVV